MHHPSSGVTIFKRNLWNKIEKTNNRTTIRKSQFYIFIYIKKKKSKINKSMCVSVKEKKRVFQTCNREERERKEKVMSEDGWIGT